MKAAKPKARAVRQFWITVVITAWIGWMVPNPGVMAFTPANLALGSQGYDVYELQNRLHYIGYFSSKVDGKFGWNTYWSVRRFQQDFGMPINGRVTMPTKLKLVKASAGWIYAGSSPKASSSSAGSGSWANTVTNAPSMINGLRQSDLNLLSHLVYAEARGEPFIGKVAVAAVVMNRLRDPKFPHSVPAIIYQPQAFTSVQDGQLNLPPDPSSMKAVMDAVHGWDPSRGATYYFNPATATSAWIWSKPQIITIGHHIFCRT